MHYDEFHQLPPSQFRRWCGVDRTTFHAIVEKILVRSGQFRLPSRPQMLNPGDETEAALVDVTEMPMERQHTLKAQVVTGFARGQFIADFCGQKQISSNNEPAIYRLAWAGVASLCCI